MNREDFPAPERGFLPTHFIVSRDLEAARDFYAVYFWDHELEEAARLASSSNRELA